MGGEQSSAGSAAEWPVRALYGDYLARPQEFVRRVEAFQEQAAAYLRAWERHDVRIGTTSWVMPRWIGMLYGRWYGTAGEFARHAFEEYARCFRTAWLDAGDAPRTILPTHGIPSRFGFAVTASDDTLTYRFSYGHPERDRRGERNEAFLDPALFAARAFPGLAPPGGHVDAIVLRIPRIHKTEEYTAREFVRRLDAFLSGLPRTHRYAVDIGNEEYCVPDCVECVRSHGAVLLLRHRDTRRSLLDRLTTPGIDGAGFSVVHATVRDGDEDLWLGIRTLVRNSAERGRALFLYLDDPGDGAVMRAMPGLLAWLDPELARLSPLRRRAA